MNEPYQYVHRQENSVVGPIATQTALYLGLAGATELAVTQGAKRAKNNMVRFYLNNMAYSEGIGSNKLIRAATAGIATKPGRIFNYGGAAVTGIIGGLLQARSQD